MAFRGAPPTETFRNAQIIFKNFSGEPTKFNKDGGVRTFDLVLTEDEATHLRDKGWTSVKPLKDRFDDDNRQIYTMKVSVSYEHKPPRCWLITEGGTKRNLLNEDLVKTYDQVELEKCDLTITGYDWEVSGESGRKAYLKSMYAWMLEDELDLEYANIPESGNPIDTSRYEQLDEAGQNPNDMDREVQPAY